MNNIAKLAVATLLGLTLFSTTALADIEKGQKIYLKKLMDPCGFSAAKFAHKHTQNEWETINEAGKFMAEVKKLCPKATIKSEYVPHVYDFVYEYAKDSGNVPSC